MIGLVKQTLRLGKKAAQVYLNHYNDSEYLNWYFNYSKHLIKFKNIHQGKDCFIIGNGPSLNLMDLSSLKNYYTFGLNKIYLIFDRIDLNLNYHVAVDSLVVEQSAKEFESLYCQTFLSYRPAHKVIRYLEHINFIMTEMSCRFQPDLLKSVPDGCTVTYAAMQIAFYMGFRRVFLIGVDHHFITAGKPDERQFLKGEDPNHFDPNYFGNMEWNLPNLEASELSYHLAKFHFSLDGRQIYDATLNGKLQTFPKISFEQALDICHKK